MMYKIYACVALAVSVLLSQTVFAEEGIPSYSAPVKGQSVKAEHEPHGKPQKLSSMEKGGGEKAQQEPPQKQPDSVKKGLGDPKAPTHEHPKKQ